jgi:hypothetical protein
MYKNQLAVAIKHNGKILRENKDVVQLPFGSEFSVLVKNLNSRRAKFTLHIDGQDALDGRDIIVDANSEVEIKRFIRNGNMNEGNAFKFIERTAAIEDGPRGIKIDDGIVRVEFWFEQEKPIVTTTIHHHYDNWHYNRSFWESPYYYSLSCSTNNSTSAAGDLSNVRLGGKSVEVRRKGILRGMTSSPENSTSSRTAVEYNAAQSMSTEHGFIPTEVNEVGITVPGSEVEQKFYTVYGFNAETTSNVIVLRLVGKIGAVQVDAPVTVKTKKKCSVCSTLNKSFARFCRECGTGLKLL